MTSPRPIISFKSLELSRSHTPRAFICSNLHSTRDRPVVLTTSTRLVVRTSINHMAYSAPALGGTVNGRGYDGQQKDAISQFLADFN